MDQDAARLNEPVLTHARTDFPALAENLTVQQALDRIRETGVGEKVVYFYVVNAEGRLLGVVPTRRLLTASVDESISRLMSPRVIAIPQTATLLEACEAFVLHKFLAFPVVDEQRRVVGMVDVGVFTDEVFDFQERERMAGVFEAIGFRASQIRHAKPLQAFRFRFPWLLTTLSSGLACALLASRFQITLARAVVLSFFLTLVLALGESVSIQSMAVTIQALRAVQPTRKWYFAALRREATTALLLGVGCATVAAMVIWIWRGAMLPGIIVGGTIMLSLFTACVFGLSVPTLLHALKLDPKISAGPITLALTDICTLLFYFTIATLLL